jgi:hypothetical protein
MLAHLRTEAYPVYRRPQYPPVSRTLAHASALSYERNNALIDQAKVRLIERASEVFDEV